MYFFSASNSTEIIWLLQILVWLSLKPAKRQRNNKTFRELLYLPSYPETDERINMSLLF